MARFIEMIDGRNQAVVKYFNVGANQNIKEGDAVQIDSATGKLVAAAAASTTLVGTANKNITTGGTVTANDNIGVTLFKNSAFRFSYTGADPTEADLYTSSIDLSDARTINTDAVSGNFVIIAYDTKNKTVDVVATSGLIY